MLAVVVSTLAIVRAFGFLQLLLGLPAILLSAWSIWVIERIFNGAWPTFLPHIAIGAACLLVVVQVVLARHKRMSNTTVRPLQACEDAPKGVTFELRDRSEE